MNAQFYADLDAVLEKHNISRSHGRDGTIVLTDLAAQQNKGRQSFDWYAHNYGLDASDYGAIVTIHGRRFKVIGIKASRPKYPFEIEDMGTGKQYKGPLSIARQIISVRAARAQSAAPAPTQPSPPQNAHSPFAAAAMF